MLYERSKTMRMYKKRLQKIIAVTLCACFIAGFSMLFAAADYDSSYQNHENWVDATGTLVNSKYNAGDKFIVYFYRPDTCANSSYVGLNSIKPWMDKGTVIYGLNCDLQYSTLPNWVYDNIGRTLPSVLFVESKTVTAYNASDYYNLSAMLSAINQKYTSFTGIELVG